MILSDKMISVCPLGQLFVPGLNLGRCDVVVVTQLPINCQRFIRIGILTKEQCVQEVRQLTTTLLDDSNQKHKLNQIKSTLSQVTNV